MLPINHLEHFTQFYISQIRLGWQCVTATQKEGETWMPSACLVLPLLYVYKTQRHLSKVCSRSSPLTVSAFTLPEEKTGHRASTDFSKGRSPPTPNATVTSRLLLNQHSTYPCWWTLPWTEDDKLSVPSTSRCLLTTKQRYGPPYLPLSVQEFSEYRYQIALIVYKKKLAFLFNTCINL